VKRSETTIKLLEAQGKEYKAEGKTIKVYYKAKRLKPRIPEEKEFKRKLRDKLMATWRQTRYATHYVDSAIRTAYQIIKSWKTNYLKGKRKRRKPVVRKRFARIKNTLFRLRNGELILTVIPRQKYLRFKLKDKWFQSRIKGWSLGEIILRDHEVILMFTKERKDSEAKGVIGWDMNLLSMDGFGEEGYIKVSLRELYRVHITYHNMRRRIQKLLRMKPKYAKRLLRRLRMRERNRVRDYIYKLTTEIARRYGGYIHVFEDLEKEGMYNRSKKHNRSIGLHDWRWLVNVLSYKVRVVQVDPRLTTRTCSRCGSLDTAAGGGVGVCRECGLRIDRQLNAAINIYLKGRDLEPSFWFGGRLWCRG